MIVSKSNEGQKEGKGKQEADKKYKRNMISEAQRKILGDSKTILYTIFTETKLNMTGFFS
jgi:hypothetical protein